MSARKLLDAALKQKNARLLITFFRGTIWLDT